MMRAHCRETRIFALIVMGALALVGSNAWAHHPEITGVAVCDDLSGEYRIDWFSEAWEGYGPDASNDLSRQNDVVDIRLDGVLIASGAYDAPDYSFSGSVGAPNALSAVLSAKAVATWGNGYGGGQTRSITVPIPTDPCIATVPDGRFTGGGHQLRVAGVRVTRGLTIHCDLLLSNNLEINWRGNHFHMMEHMTTVACTDDPNIIQDPPAAPLDTLIGIGEGRFNGLDGYTIEFVLVDAGEPGRQDEMGFVIYETANPGSVILNVPQQQLDGGNLQAHYDQPHK